MLLNEAFQEFVFECQSKGLSSKTVENYEVNLKIFLRFLSKKDIREVEDITKRHVKEFTIKQNKQGYEESYINANLTIIKLFLKYLYDESYIFDEIEVKNIKKKYKVIETFTDNEVKKILDVAKKGKRYTDVRNYTILNLMIDTGLRAGEIINLEHKHIKENNTIYVFGKGKKERIVPCSPTLRKILMRYERMKRNYFSDKVMLPTNYFLTQSGDTITRFVLQNMVIQIGKKAGVERDKLFPHNFRHYMAVASLKNGLDLYSLSRLLGHSEVSTTEVYASSIKDEEIQELSLKSSPLMNLIK
ncbi:tyrosine-type recombinase/integrase [Wukongibacter sp. M2B1]|uniref:tyrosine-type recombinase/integrase n=1 Tax=Wukongibacter sp. M2B1 TaxID=3088895 RepID=UPI003D7A596C